MEPFKSILVSVDAGTEADHGLDHAIRLARRCGAALTIADVLPPGASAAAGRSERDLVETRRRWISGLADAARPVSAATMLLEGPASDALIREVLRSDHDLLMRGTEGPSGVGVERLVSAVEMDLVRKCPCPVLLARHRRSPTESDVVGAVNATSEDAEERALNGKIADLTLLMAELEQRRPVLLHAWTPFGERTVRSHAPAAAFGTYVDQAHRRSIEAIEQLSHSHGGAARGGIATSLRGAPEHVIPRFVATRGIDLVVLGTAARRGVAGFLIGNTAERIVHRLACSVLIVKPDGFVSPASRGAG
jgi:universal stress protein E